MENQIIEKIEEFYIIAFELVSQSDTIYYMTDDNQLEIMADPGDYDMMSELVGNRRLADLQDLISEYVQRNPNAHLHINDDKSITILEEEPKDAQQKFIDDLQSFIENHPYYKEMKGEDITNQDSYNEPIKGYSISDVDGKYEELVILINPIA